MIFYIVLFEWNNLQLFFNLALTVATKPFFTCKDSCEILWRWTDSTRATLVYIKIELKILKNIYFHFLDIMGKQISASVFMFLGSNKKKSGNFLCKDMKSAAVHLDFTSISPQSLKGLESIHDWISDNISFFILRPKNSKYWNNPRCRTEWLRSQKRLHLTKTNTLVWQQK